MSDIRNRIAFEVDSEVNQYATWGERDFDAVDNIIRIVREALLSSDASMAAENAGHYDSVLGVVHHCGGDAVEAAMNIVGLSVAAKAAGKGGEG